MMNKRKLSILIVLVFASIISAAEPIWEESFDSKAIKRKMALEMVSITPDTKYQLEMKVNSSSDKAGWELVFYDKNGNVPLYGVKHDSWQTFNRVGSHNYVQVFYSPGNAVKMQLVLNNPTDQTVTLEKVLLKPGPAETMNINPGFNNNSGFDQSTNCKRVQIDGKNALRIMNTRYGMAILDLIPVSPGEAYDIYLQRTALPKNAKTHIVVYLCYYDANYRRLDRRADNYTFYPMWDGVKIHSKQKTVPPKARYLKCVIAFRYNSVDKVDITRISLTKRK